MNAMKMNEIVSLTHSLGRGSINNFDSLSSYKIEDLAKSFNSNDLINKYITSVIASLQTIISNVNLTEQFNPLVRVDFEMKNSINIKAEIKKEILHCEATYFRLSWAELVNTLHKDQVPLEKVKELAGKVLSKSPLKLNHEDNLYQMIWYANRMYSDPSDPITNENASAERASCVANALNM